MPVRVLVVDDYHDAANALGLLLKLLGADVRVCHEGTEALQVARTFDPHIGLLDVDMKGMSGLELARRLRQDVAGRPLMLVAVTGVATDDARERTAAAGFDLHWTKTWDMTELLPHMTAFCRTHYPQEVSGGLQL